MCGRVAAAAKTTSEADTSNTCFILRDCGLGRSLVAAVVLSTVVATATGAAQPGASNSIVGRATAYVVDFVERFSNLVAEERYVQQTSSPRRRRELKSDFLLAKPPGSSEWFQFRDVFEVDGRSVRDRDQRLAKLFLDAPGDVFARAVEMMREGSRFNLEDVGTLSMPLIALSFLQPRYVTRFRFVVGPLDRDVGDGVRLVQFFESRKPTILRRAAANGDLAASGRFWIEANSGRVIRTQLLAGGVEVITSFAFDDALQTAVPTEMRDSYAFRASMMTGVATYGKFRKFGVSTEETLSLPKPP